NANAGLAPLLPSGAVPSVVKEISQALTLDEIIRCLEKYFFAVCEYISRVYGQEKAELLIAEANGCFKDDDALIRKAKVFIKERINKNIHISDVADAVHLSSSYFAIYFKNKTGETLRDYLLQEKMEWASKALLKRAESVEVIADCLGYSDYHAFSRAFKKIYGKSPSAFRADSNE
ncbi:MAG: AraC family transcriptional regulator, partial [Treponema sp.]|nr:AraC family transcriptional regulator [Treponema sp.]